MTQLAKYRPLSGSHLAEECLRPLGRKGARRQVLAEECLRPLGRKVSGVIILLKSVKKPSIEDKGSGEHARAGLYGEEYKSSVEDLWSKDHKNAKVLVNTYSLVNTHSNNPGNKE